MSVLLFRGLSVSFGGTDIFAGLTASIPRDGRVGLVGPNGIGKTTLLRVLAGGLMPFSGSISIAKGTRIGYLQQEAVRAFSDTESTVYAEMLTVFADLLEQEAKLRQIENDMAQGRVTEALLESYGTLQESFELAGGYEYPVRIRQVLSGLGFDEEEQHMPIAHCSGGQKTRALLARLLLEQPDLLILDEPTNHLDVAAVEWLENALRTWQSALLVVSHDRYFLDQVTNSIWEMGENGLEVYRGNYSAYVEQWEERWARREAEFESAKQRFVRELDYVKKNIARDATSNQAKGRLKRLIRMVKAVELGGAGMLDKDWIQVTDELDISRSKWTVSETERRVQSLTGPNPSRHQIRMRLAAGRRGGNIVLRTKDLCVGYVNKLLFDADDIVLRRRERVAIVGPNGVGKTTLLRTLLGEIEPLSGEIQLGANLNVAYFGQSRDWFDPTLSVLEAFRAEHGMLPGSARDYLARYLFCGDDVFKPVGALSGGEQSRLALAVLSLERGNLLLLDEPTNHLDIVSQEVLEEALLDFEGTMLMVTHDRYLVDRVATQVWELEGRHLYVYRGSYAFYTEEKRKRQAMAKQRKPEPAVERTERRLTRGNDVNRARTLVQTEARIVELEARLVHLGEELASTTNAGEWKKVEGLVLEQDTVQSELNALLTEWEGLAQVVA